jgi:threonine dehydrogenase-like Zn-dependent dehydrogenase
VPARFEWTPHYFKEVALLGSNAFGIEQIDGVRQHAFEHYLQMVEGGRLDVSSLITHRFGLEEFREAFLVMHDKARHNAVKAVFSFAPD